MIYKCGRKWAVIGGSVRYNTKEEAYASIEEGHNNGQDSTGVVAESADRWVHEPVADSTDSSPDWDN